MSLKKSFTFFFGEFKKKLKMKRTIVHTKFATADPASYLGGCETVCTYNQMSSFPCSKELQEMLKCLKKYDFDYSKISTGCVKQYKELKECVSKNIFKE